MLESHRGLEQVGSDNSPVGSTLLLVPDLAGEWPPIHYFLVLREVLVRVEVESAHGNCLPLIV